MISVCVCRLLLDAGRIGYEVEVNGRNQCGNGTVPMNVWLLAVKARPCSFTRKRPPAGSKPRSTTRKS